MANGFFLLLSCSGVLKISESKNVLPLLLVLICKRFEVVDVFKNINNFQFLKKFYKIKKKHCKNISREFSISLITMHKVKD